MQRLDDGGTQGRSAIVGSPLNLVDEKRQPLESIASMETMQSVCAALECSIGVELAQDVILVLS